MKIAWPKHTSEDVAAPFTSAVRTSRAAAWQPLGEHGVATREASERGPPSLSPPGRASLRPLGSRPAAAQGKGLLSASALLITAVTTAGLIIKNLELTVPRVSAAQTGHPFRSFPRPSNSFPLVNRLSRESM